MKRSNVFLSAAVLAFTLALPASAEKYALSTILAPTHLITIYQHQEFADNVREATNGEIDFWQALSDEQRRILLDMGALSIVRLQMAYDAEVGGATAWAKEHGIEFYDAEPAFKEAVKTWLDDGLGGAFESAKANFGIDDPEALFASFEPYITKWDGLLASVDRKDEAALYNLLKTEVVDNVDVTNYGMN